MCVSIHIDYPVAVVAIVIPKFIVILKLEIDSDTDLNSDIDIEVDPNKAKRT